MTILTGLKVSVVDASRPEVDVARMHANIDESRRLLGYDPRIPVEERMERFLAFEPAVGKLGG